MTVMDSLGKIVANTAGMNMTVGELRTLLGKSVGPATKVSDKEAKDRKKLEKILEEFTDYLEQLTKDSKDMADNLDAIKRSSEKTARASGKGGGGGGGSGGGGRGGIGGFGDPGREGEKWAAEFGRTASQGLKTFAAGITSMLTGGTSALGTLFGGLGQTMQFKTDMRAIAFQTEGITASSTKLQNQFSDIGDVVAQTGFELNRIQAVTIKAMRNGLKKADLEVVKIGAHLATMVDTDLDSTTDMFTSWHHQLGLSEESMRQIGLNAKDVSRLTGITGENLTKAMQSSTKFMMNLRNIGQLTASANKSILTALAEADKLGISDQVEKTLGALTGAKQYFNAPEETKRLIAAGAASSGGQVSMKDVMAGNVLKDRDKVQGLLSGIDKVVTRISGVDLNNLDNLDPDKLWQVNLALQNAYGMSLEEFKRHRQALELQGMSLSDFTAKMQKENANQMTTEDEKLANLKKLEQKKLDMSQAFGNEATEMIKKRGLEGGLAAMESRLAKSKTDTKDIEFLRKDLGLEGMSNAQVALVAQAKQLAKMGGKDVSGQIEKALKKGDTKALGEAVGDLNKATEQYNTDQKKSLDPMTSAAMEMKKLNEAFANTIAPLLTAVIDFIGPTGVMVAIFSGIALSMASMAASVAMNSLSIVDKLGGIDKLKGLLGKGGMLSGVGTRAGGLLTSATGLGARAGGLLSSAATGVGARAGGLLTGLAGRGAAAGAGAAGAAAGASNPIGWIVTAAIASFAAIEQGAESAKKASEIFGTKTLTASQKWAADSAGIITGGLNFITFGIFDSFIGPTGYITTMVAQFANFFWPLNMAFQATLVPIKVLWGILKGLGLFVYEVLSPIFEFLWQDILVPVGESLSEVGGLFGDVATAIGSILGFEGGFADISGTISGFMRDVGKAIGGFIRGTIGLVKGIWPYVGPIVAMINPITRVFALLMNLGTILKGLRDMIYGIFTFDPKMIGEGFSRATSGLVATMLGLPVKMFDKLWVLFTSLPQMIADAVGAAVTGALNFASDAVGMADKAAQAGADTVGLGWAYRGAKDVAGWAGSWLGYEKGSPKIVNDGMAMLHKGEMVIPAAFANEISALLQMGSAGSAGSFSEIFAQSPIGRMAGMMGDFVNPVLGNITDTVRGEKATSPSEAASDMEMITSLTVEQNMILAGIAQGINRMVSIMDSQGGGDTDTESMPHRPSNFGRWPYTAASGGSRQITEVGI